MKRLETFNKWVINVDFSSNTYLNCFILIGKVYVWIEFYSDLWRSTMSGCSIPKRLVSLLLNTASFPTTFNFGSENSKNVKWGKWGKIIDLSTIFEVGTFWSCSIYEHGKPQNYSRDGLIIRMFQIFRIFLVFNFLRFSEFFKDF